MAPRAAECVGDNASDSPRYPLPRSRAAAMAAAVTQQGPGPGAASSKGQCPPPSSSSASTQSCLHLLLHLCPSPPSPPSQLLHLWLHPDPTSMSTSPPFPAPPVSISSLSPLIAPPPPPSLAVAAPLIPTHPAHARLGSAPGFRHSWCCHPTPRPPLGTATPRGGIQAGQTPDPGLIPSAVPGPPPGDTEPFLSPRTGAPGWTLGLFHVSLIETAGGGAEPRTKAGCRNRGLHRPRCGGPPTPK